MILILILIPISEGHWVVGGGGGVPPRCARARTRFGGTPSPNFPFPFPKCPLRGPSLLRCFVFTSAKVRQKGARARTKFGGPSPPPQNSTPAEAAHPSVASEGV